jgi:hypothetical protein
MVSSRVIRGLIGRPRRPAHHACLGRLEGQRQALRSRHAAHGGDYRHEYCHRHHLFDGGAELADHPGGDEGREQVDAEPDAATHRAAQHRGEHVDFLMQAGRGQGSEFFQMHSLWVAKGLSGSVAWPASGGRAFRRCAAGHAVVAQRVKQDDY